MSRARECFGAGGLSLLLASWVLDFKNAALFYFGRANIINLKIIFRERQISEAPTSVLRHLYYHTVQYGLSVKQFTGEHQDYWRKLPSRFRKERNEPRKLNAIIKELEKLAEGYDERLRKRQSQFKKWGEKEIIINAQLVSILAALPEELLAMVFKKLTGAKDLPKAFNVVDFYIERQKRFVEPDLLLLGNDYLLMIELKTRGGHASSRNYPFNQLLNYARLAVECQDSNNRSLPVKFSHLILVPTVDKKWLEDYQNWISSFDINTNKLYVNANNCIRRGNEYTKKHSKQIRKLLSTKMSIYYYSWSQLSKAFDIAVIKFNDKRNRKHWNKIGDELKGLAKIACRFTKKLSGGYHA